MKGPWHFTRVRARVPAREDRRAGFATCRKTTTMRMRKTTRTKTKRSGIDLVAGGIRLAGEACRRRGADEGGTTEHTEHTEGELEKAAARLEGGAAEGMSGEWSPAG